MTSRTPHGSNAPVDNSWMRNYEAVEYDVPLLHPHARTDSGDEDEERGNGSGSGGIRRGTGAASLKSTPTTSTPQSQAQPPLTLPKIDLGPSLTPSSLTTSAPAPPPKLLNSFSSPNINTTASATPARLPMPARAYTNNNTRGVSSTSGSAAGAVNGGANSTASASLGASPGAGSGNVGSLVGGPGQALGQGQGQVQIPPFQVLSTTTTTTNSHSLPPSSTLTSAASFPGLSTVATNQAQAQAQAQAPRSPRGSGFRSSPLATGMNGLGGSSGNLNGNGNGHGNGLGSTLPAGGIPSLSSSSSSTPIVAPSIPNGNGNGHGTAHSGPGGFAFPPSAGSVTSVSPAPTANSASAPMSPPTAYGGRPHSRSGYIQRMASSDAAAADAQQGRASAESSLIGPPVGFRDYNGLGHVPHHGLHASSSRGSMILYRLSATEDGALLPPPVIPGGGGAFGGGHRTNRSSVYSNSGDSIVSLGGDSKHPLMGSTPVTPSVLGPGLRTRPSTPGMPGTPGGGSIGARGGSHTLSEIGKTQGGLVAYEYNPDEDADADELDEEEEEWIKIVGGRVVGDYQYNPKGKVGLADEKGKLPLSSSTQPLKPPPTPPASGKLTPAQIQLQLQLQREKSLASNNSVSWRGLMNVGTLVVLIAALLCLFIVFPVTEAFSDNGVSARILGNTRINATGQAGPDFTLGGGNGNTDTTGNGNGNTDTTGTGTNGGTGTGTRRREVALDGVEIEVREWRWERRVQ